jgi:hypothetical protein
MRLALLFPVVLAASTGHAAAPRPVVQAAWKASAGGGVLHGNVSAQATSAAGNAVVGSWTLVNAGVVTLHGTWSGKKVGTGWRGTWQAKIAPAGGTFAGTWQAAPPADFHGRTFEDLLRAAREVEISGTWTSNGGGRGPWWLEAAAP